jgi:hypothetical protein
MQSIRLEPQKTDRIAPTSEAARMDDTSSQSASLASILALTRKGAYLKSTPGGAEIFSPRNDFTAAIAHIDEQALSIAMTAGWLRERANQCWELSEKGVAAMRLVRGGSTGTETAPVAEKARARRLRPSAVPAENPAESPLGWLRRRRDKDGNSLLSDPQFEAGERLRADFWFAQMTPRVTASWSPAASSRRERNAAPGAGVELQDHVVAAKERVHRALKAVGPELAGILIDVCCHLKGLEDAERALGWPQRSGKVVLLMALTRLARHYGLVTEGNGAYSPFQPIRHWGTSDYRPTDERWR